MFWVKEMYFVILNFFRRAQVKPVISWRKTQSCLTRCQRNSVMGKSNKSTSEFEEIHVKNYYSSGKTRSCKVTRSRRRLIFAVSHVCLPHEGASSFADQQRQLSLRENVISPSLSTPVISVKTHNYLWFNDFINLKFGKWSSFMYYYY
jgi:hypothetical protein